MIIQSSRFGSIEFTEDDVVTIRDGILGFPEYERYVILNHKEGSAFRWLHCVERHDLAFLIAEPGNFRSDYYIDIPDAISEELGLGVSSPVLVYAIASIPAGRPQDMTLNLAGPIVINCETRQGRQVVVEDARWETRARAFAVVQQPVAEERAAA